MRTYTPEEAKLINEFYPLEPSAFVAAGEIVDWVRVMQLVQRISDIATEANFPMGHPLFSIAGVAIKTVDCSIFSDINTVLSRVLTFIRWYMKNK